MGHFKNFAGVVMKVLQGCGVQADFEAGVEVAGVDVALQWYYELMPWDFGPFSLPR